MHYCLPPLERFDLGDVLALIEQQKYLVLHAPRQTGKTSCLLALAEYLNEQGRSLALYANIESAQVARDDYERGIPAIVYSIAMAARDRLNDEAAEPLAHQLVTSRPALTVLQEFLTLWCKRSPRPVVLMLDEVDALVGDTLISLLRQLRAGYTNRPAQFPQSVILCGVRDVRDYRIHSDREKAIITGGSAFNIKAESLRLGDFNQEEVSRLYQQHTAASGQVFTAEALALAWELTRGQPWLVNALAYEACFKMKAGRERSRPISAASFQEAKESLIQRRETHLDQLADKLQEPRVRRVIEPILLGEMYEKDFNPLDVQYLVDLGLLRQAQSGEMQIANPIYQEVIPRELTWGVQSGMALNSAWYLRPDGKLDMAKLLAAFQEFFREHSEHWVERFDYKEAGPQLLLQAFLQRIVNGGGRVEREYGLGRLRTDLLVLWPRPQGSEREAQRVVIELKLLNGTLEKTLDAIEKVKPKWVCSWNKPTISRTRVSGSASPIAVKSRSRLNRP